MQNRKNSSYDIYQNITDQIIEKLEQGFIPWHKPWSAYGAAFSYITRKPYRGINALLMNMLPYEKPYYLTFKQAKDLGGTVRKEYEPSLSSFGTSYFFMLTVRKSLPKLKLESYQLIRCLNPLISKSTKSSILIKSTISRLIFRRLFLNLKMKY